MKISQEVKLKIEEYITASKVSYDFIQLCRLAEYGYSLAKEEGKISEKIPQESEEVIERLTESFYPKKTINWDKGIQKHVNFLRDTVKSGVTIGYKTAKEEGKASIPDMIVYRWVKASDRLPPEAYVGKHNIISFRKGDMPFTGWWWPDKKLFIDTADAWFACDEIEWLEPTTLKAILNQ